MKYIKTSKNTISEDELDLIIDYFKSGKIVVYPTDTIYGLGCRADQAKSVERVLEIKKRDLKKSLIILVSSLSMLKRYCYVNSAQEKYLKKIWNQTRPTTIILKSKGKLPKEVSGGRDTLAIRLPNLPKSKFLIKMIRGAKVPIISTSLNISGKKNLESVSNLDNYFKKAKPDLVINIGTMKSRPSKLIDISDIDNIRILRK